MLRFVTTADTEILATATRSNASPTTSRRFAARTRRRPGPGALIEDLLDGARVVLCRILGGRRGWPEGFDLLRDGATSGDRAARARRRGEPDAEMTGLSLALRGGGRAGRRVSATRGRGQRRAAAAVPRRHVPVGGVRVRAAARGGGPRGVPAGDRGRSIQRALARPRSRPPDGRACFYRSHRLTGNTAFVDALCDPIERRARTPGGLELHAASRSAMASTGA